MGVFHEKDDADLRRYMGEVDGEMRAFDRDLKASLKDTSRPERMAMLAAFSALKWERLFRGPRSSDEKGPIGWAPFHEANKGWVATALTFELDEKWAQVEAFEFALLNAQKEAVGLGASLPESGNAKAGPDFDTKGLSGNVASIGPMVITGIALVAAIALLRK